MAGFEPAEILLPKQVGYQATGYIPKMAEAKRFELLSRHRCQPHRVQAGPDKPLPHASRKYGAAPPRDEKDSAKSRVPASLLSLLDLLRPLRGGWSS